MFEKSNHQETASTTVQPMHTKSATVVRPTDVVGPPRTKTPEQEVASELSPENVSIIGPDVIFKGELMAGDDIFIHGTIEGMIARHTKNVVVGRKGRVTAIIHATTVTVHGQVDGDIYGDDVVKLMEGAKVNGNIFTPCIIIDAGAKFNGTINMA